MIYTVILWANGQIMVFDREGQQMPSYQGADCPELRRRIVREAPIAAEFFLGNGNLATIATQKITRAQFEAEGGRPQ